MSIITEIVEAKDIRRACLEGEREREREGKITAVRQFASRISVAEAQRQEMKSVHGEWTLCRIPAPNPSGAPQSVPSFVSLQLASRIYGKLF